MHDFTRKKHLPKFIHVDDWLKNKPQKYSVWRYKTWKVLGYLWVWINAQKCLVKKFFYWLREARRFSFLQRNMCFHLHLKTNSTNQNILKDVGSNQRVELKIDDLATGSLHQTKLMNIRLRLYDAIVSNWNGATKNKTVLSKTNKVNRIHWSTCI